MERGRRGHRDHGAPTVQMDRTETDALRAEVKALKDRVAVLERLATDSTSALDREFEKLRRQD